ncbi:MAG: GC-type dockerin domain-anchored protein [Phycisphaerales bacterium JB040]
MKRLMSPVSLALCAGTLSAQPVLVESTFDSDAEGWTVTSIVNSNLCGTPGAGTLRQSEFVADGGDPGGFFRHVEQGVSGTSFFRAPVSFHGDLSSAYGGVFGWSWRASGSNKFEALEDIYIQGAGMTVWAGTPFAGGRWGRAHVPLVEGVWRLSIPGCTSCCGSPGPFATEQELRAILSDVTAVLIRAEHRSGSETVDLDSVGVFLPIAGIPSDDFESGANGWSILRDAEISWGADLGNGDGGLRGVDDAVGQGFSFIAPEPYLADRSDLVGRTMLLDLRSSAAVGGSSSFEDGGGFVVIAGAGTEARFRLDKLPIIGNIWRSHEIPLVPSPAWTGPDGSVIEVEDFERIFSSISRVQIRGEYRNGGETTWIDNIAFGVGSPSVVVSPAELEGCFDEVVELSAAAGGDAPIEYRWYRDDVALTDDGVYSGAFTAELVFHVSDTTLDGVYECRVTNGLGQAASNEVRLEARVCCPADLTGSSDPNGAGFGEPNGVVDSDDFFFYLDGFVAGTVGVCDLTGSSDPNDPGFGEPDGVCDGEDFFFYLDLFVSGCP